MRDLRLLERTRRWVPRAIRALLLSDWVWRTLPTPAVYYSNKVNVKTAAAIPALPDTEWSQRERRALLTASNERLRSMEGKGPGLATITAVIFAAVLVALVSGWDESEPIAKIMLALATFYTLLSLCTPIYLVGPVKRHTVHIGELEKATEADHPEEALAAQSLIAAVQNDLENLRLANHLDAARRELTYAFLLLIFWALLVPATGLGLNATPDLSRSVPGWLEPPLPHRDGAPGMRASGQ